MEEFDNDFLVYWRLSSIYQALTSSAVTPVCVPSDIAKQQRAEPLLQSLYSHQFFDTIEDEAAGRQIMVDRLHYAGNDIEKHMRLHQLLLEATYTIDERTNVHDREGVVAAAHVIENLLFETQDLVQKHQKEQGAQAFLMYPTCLPGHYFHMREKGVYELIFNPAQTYAGVTEGAEALISALPDFSIKTTPLPNQKLNEGYDLGEGINDSSLRGRIALTEEYIRRTREQDWHGERYNP